MGFISLTDCLSGQSIPNIHASHPHAGKPVYLLQPNGPTLCEQAYEGKGHIATNIFVWLAIHNVQRNIDEMSYEQLVCEGKQMLKQNATLNVPLKVTLNANARYELCAPSEPCQYDGFYYPPGSNVRQPTEIFRLKKLHGGSERYGVCEVCQSEVDRSYLLTVTRCVVGTRGTQYQAGPQYFGHKRCLQNLTQSRGEDTQ